MKAVTSHSSAFGGHLKFPVSSRKILVRSEAPTVQPVPGVEILQPGPPPPPPTQGIDFVLQTLSEKSQPESLGDKQVVSVEDAASVLEQAAQALGSSTKSLANAVEESAAGAAGSLSHATENAVETANSVKDKVSDQLSETLYTVQQNLSTLAGSTQQASEQLRSQVLNQADTALSHLPPGVRDAIVSIATYVSEKAHENPQLAAGIATVPLLLGINAAFGGFSGFLSAEKAMRMLQNESNVLLVDIRSYAVLLQTKSIPELKRAALGKGVVVPPVELLPSVKRQVRNPAKLAIDILGAEIAGLARVTPGVTRVVIMDSNGRGNAFARDVARAVKNASRVRRVYVMADGFQGWVNAGLPTKKGTNYDAGPLAVVADNAEEVIEEATATLSNPQAATAAVILGGALAWGIAHYHYVLQLIGVVGLELSLAKKLSEYDSVDDFYEDVGSVLAPLKAALVVGQSEAGPSALPAGDEVIAPEDVLRDVAPETGLQ